MGISMTFTRVPRELKISRDTARLLSQATYHQLVIALRELVANAHDANASQIRLTLALKESSGGEIKIADDGDGMSSEEFNDEFLNLGKTSKLPLASGEVRKNRFGRPVLGRFGIGFISAIPFAGEVLVETKRRDEEAVSGVRINCGAILTGSGPGEESSFSFPGWSRSPTPEDPDKFTRVELIGLSRRAYDSIDTSIQSGWYQMREGRNQPIDTARRNEYLRDWLSRILPLGYHDCDADERLKEALQKLLPADFLPARITVNGHRLRRVLPEARLVEEFELSGTEAPWTAKGVLWSPFEAIAPVYSRGVAVRVGDMSIGEPGYFSLNLIGRVYGKLQHIAGEVQVRGLEPDLRLDRDWFYATPATDEFQEAVREKITEFEGKLQKKANVMQRFRVLKKDVESLQVVPTGRARVAPILKVPERVQKLVEQARQAGIQVRVEDDSSFTVPKGEGRVTVGRDFGVQLRKVLIGRKTLTFDFVESGPELTTERLVHELLESDRSRVVFSGPHVLISTDGAAVANLRLLAALKEEAANAKLTPGQIKSLLDSLTLTYR